jgi:hypothetical protein
MKTELHAHARAALRRRLRVEREDCPPVRERAAFDFLARLCGFIDAGKITSAKEIDDAMAAV